jgi:hypothetical protein
MTSQHLPDRPSLEQLHRAAMFGHAEAARVLLAHGAAGSPLEWNAPEKAPEPERMHEQLAELCRAVATAAP